MTVATAQTKQKVVEESKVPNQSFLCLLHLSLLSGKPWRNFSSSKTDTATFRCQKQTGGKIHELDDGEREREKIVKTKSSKNIYKLAKKSRYEHKMRKYCCICYTRNVTKRTETVAKNATEVVTSCVTGPAQPHFCPSRSNKNPQRIWTFNLNLRILFFTLI